MSREVAPSHCLLRATCLIWMVALVWSGIKPFDRLTWLMEVLPVLIAMPILVWNRDRFRLTPLLTILICIHGVILIYGGAYSYSRAPLGYWLQEVLGGTRNPYDKIGHFAQGFVPAMIARELFLRGNYVRGKIMPPFLALCVAMTVSAIYELIEWGAALLLGQGADEFLGTQGYAWDTQSDIFLAFLGAIAALLLLSRWHDQQLSNPGCSGVANR